MSREKEILSLLVTKNYISTKEVANGGIPPRFLSFLAAKGGVSRISRGIYSLPGELPDEYFIIASKSENAVFSNLTALYLHGLSDRIPIILDVTVKSSYKGSLQRKENVKLYYVKNEVITLGLTQVVTSFGNTVKCYDRERSICDIIKNKNTLDLELVNNAIRNYFYSNEKDLSTLYYYAEELNISKKIRNTLEVLT